jgi:hydrogenase/urease accessory protein HupE
MITNVLRSCAAAALLSALGVASTASAHEARPLYLDVTETSTNKYRLSVRVPASVPDFNRPNISPPPTCEAQGLQWTCTNGLQGQQITITYPRFNPAVSMLARFSFLNGEEHTLLTAPDETTLNVPSEEQAGQIAAQYSWLGMTHIFGGYDHLLFLFCLMIIARFFKRILWVVTGFTLAHSLTLVASALGWLRIPIAPVEAVIALSVLFLAVEIARTYQQKNDGKHSLTWRYPALVSSSFGLLHGLGFASVLSEIGLPQTAALIALVSFNLGVEAGQVLIVGAALLLIAFFAPSGERWAFKLGQKTEHMLIYAIGILSAFWVIDRLTAMIA